MAVSKNNRAARALVANDKVYVKRVTKAHAYVRTSFVNGVQKQEWFNDAACTLPVVK